MINTYMKTLTFFFLVYLSSNIVFGQENRGVIIENETQNGVSGKYHAIIISENQKDHLLISGSIIINNPL